MQAVGFLAMTALFCVCGAAFPILTASKPGLMTFQALYFLTSFWNQFGPNCTTWLVAGKQLVTSQNDDSIAPLEAAHSFPVTDFTAVALTQA